MTVLESAHRDHGATFLDRAGRRLVDHYGRPARTHRAVRNAVGVVEMGYGVVALEGADRVDFVDNAVSNRVPDAEGAGCYALMLDPQGAVETDLYVYNAGERLLCLTPPGRADPLAEEWAGKTFIQDVSVRAATEEFAVLGVHGPTATEKVASVLAGAAAPAEPLSFVRGAIDDAGVTVVRGDGLAGEEGYEVVCAAGDAPRVFDALVNRGPAAAPFGHRTWGTLTLEAGTPLFETELRGRIPNRLGLRNAVDFEKGCFVGQEVVSRIENRGRVGRRLVGLQVEGDAVPPTGATVRAGEREVGEVTRAATSPVLESIVALALVDADAGTDLALEHAAGTTGASVVDVPFVEGSERSARRPTYLDH